MFPPWNRLYLFSLSQNCLFVLVDLLNITFIGFYLEREKYFLSAFHVIELLPWFQMLSLQYCAVVASTCCTLEKRVFCCLWTFVQYFFFEKAEDNCEVVAVCKFQNICIYIYYIRSRINENGYECTVLANRNTSKVVAWKVCQRQSPNRNKCGK